jgi:hypothetical protein
MDGGAAMKTDSGKYDTAGDCLFELSLHVRPGHPCHVTRRIDYPCQRKFHCGKDTTQRLQK